MLIELNVLNLVSSLQSCCQSVDLKLVFSYQNFVPLGLLSSQLRQIELISLRTEVFAGIWEEIV